MSRRNSISGQMSPKAQAYLRLALGAIGVIAMIFTLIGTITKEAKKPDDAEYFEGEVTKVLSVTTDYKRKKKSNGTKKKVKVYDCSVIIEYDVNGQTYEYNYVANDRSSAIKVGNTFYVEVSPSNPNKVYSVSATKNSFMNTTMKYIFPGLIGLVSIILLVSGLKAVKKEDSVGSNSNLWH